MADRGVARDVAIDDALQPLGGEARRRAEDYRRAGVLFRRALAGLDLVLEVETEAISAT